MWKFLAFIFISLNPFSVLVSQDAPDPLVQELQAQSDFILSAVWQSNPNFLPIRNWNINQPEIEAAAGLIFAPDRNKILYQKNIEAVRPIASLTKLMTAWLVIQEMNLEKAVKVSPRAVQAYGDNVGLVIEEKLSIENLLKALLISSSNDAAIALSEAFEENSLVDLMNEKAAELELAETHFVEPSGYDPGNLSTALDLAKLVKYSLEEELIWQILSQPSLEISSVDGQFNHHLINTNQLLGSRPNILGGKTGYTEEAGGCLILIIEQKVSAEKLIIVILGAEDRFAQAERLINWLEQAYLW